MATVKTAAVVSVFFALGVSPLQADRMIFSYAKGKQYAFTIERDALAAAPAWGANAADPPLSAHDAIKAANEMLFRIVKDTRGWRLTSATLDAGWGARNRDEWFWLIKYLWHPVTEKTGAILPSMRIPVLMDGKAISPSEAEHKGAFSLRDFPEHNSSVENREIDKVTERALRGSASWIQDAANPVLPARKALQLADAKQQAIVKGTKFEDNEDYQWKFHSLTLGPGSDGKWSWHAAYHRRFLTGFSTGVPPMIHIVVEMDGTVTESGGKSR